MKTIVFANTKGGCGKTASVRETAYCMALRKKKILLIDLDSQFNLTTSFHMGVPEKKHICSVLDADIKLTDAILHTEYDGIDIICGSPLMLAEHFDAAEDMLLLREALRCVPDGAYDYVFVDTAPSANTLRAMALAAADYVVGVSSPAADSRDGLLQLGVSIKSLKKAGMYKAELIGIIVCDVERSFQSKAGAESIAAIAQVLDTKVFDTVIRHTVKIDESREAYCPVNVYAKNCSAALDYRHLTYEILERIGGL